MLCSIFHNARNLFSERTSLLACFSPKIKDSRAWSEQVNIIREIKEFVSVLTVVIFGFWFLFFQFANAHYSDNSPLGDDAPTVPVSHPEDMVRALCPCMWTV